MKKRCLLLSLILGLFLINILLVSAYGSYSSFSLGDFFNDIDEDTMILGAVLVISFAVLNFALARVFRGNTKTAGVVSFALSLLITWGVNKSGFDFQSLFYNIGISGDFFSAILPIVILIGALIIIWKLGIGFFFFIAGIFLFTISVFTDLIYSKGIATVISIGFILLGAWIIARKRKRYMPGYNNYHGYSRWQKPLKKTRWGSGKSRYDLDMERKYRKYQEAEAKRRAEQARREQETEEKQRQKAYAKNQKRDEEARRQQEDNVRKRNEQARQYQKAEAKRKNKQQSYEENERRKAEQARKYQEAEAKRRAEQAKQYQKAEAKRRAEQARKYQEAEAKRRAEQARREQEKRGKVLLLEEKTRSRKLEEVNKKIRHLQRAIVKVESKNGKRDTPKSRKLREQLIKLLRKKDRL